MLRRACRLQPEIRNKARVGTTYPCVVPGSAGTVESIQATVQGHYPGGDWAGCKNTGIAQVLVDTNTQFWPNAEYAKHRGVTRMKVGVLATMILGALIGYPIASLAGLAPDADGDGIPDVLDKCVNDSRNASLTCDRDQDGYGNVCDGDFNKSNTATSA